MLSVGWGGFLLLGVRSGGVDDGGFGVGGY
jgi:hypothetical protein